MLRTSIFIFLNLKVMKYIFEWLYIQLRYLISLQLFSVFHYLYIFKLHRPLDHSWLYMNDFIILRKKLFHSNKLSIYYIGRHQIYICIYLGIDLCNIVFTYYLHMFIHVISMNVCIHKSVGYQTPRESNIE